jgi:hypothetical protein
MDESVFLNDFAKIGNPNAPIGSVDWCRASHLNLCIHKRNSNNEVGRLKLGLIEFKTLESWRQLNDQEGRPFEKWEDYVQHPEPQGLGMSVKEANDIIREKNNKRLLREILNRHGAPIGNQNAAKDNLKNKGSSRTFVSRGDNKEYVLARIARDFPEKLDLIQRGEVGWREIGESLGIIRNNRSIRLSIDPKHAAEQIRRFGDDFAAEVKKCL